MRGPESEIDAVESSKQLKLATDFDVYWGYKASRTPQEGKGTRGD